MEQAAEAGKLVSYIGHIGLQIPTRRPSQKHVGAIIADAVLQVGHRWTTQVGPRVQRLRDAYPEANTISKLSQLLNTRGARELLDWNGQDQQEVFRITVSFFQSERIETFDDLRTWLESDSNTDRLLTKGPRDDKAGIPRIGHATADYYRVLVGIPDAVKVDSRVRKFLSDAGIDVKKYRYEELRTIVRLAAKLLGKRPLDVDSAIWNSDRKVDREVTQMDQHGELSISLPLDKIRQLEIIARERYGETPERLAKFWIIEKLPEQYAPHDSPSALGPTPESVGVDTVSQKMTNRQKIKNVVVGNWEFGQPFRRKELISKVRQTYPEIKESEVMPADRAINSLSGYSKNDRDWEKKDAYLFARSDGGYERYNPNSHGLFECIDDGNGYKRINGPLRPPGSAAT